MALDFAVASPLVRPGRPRIRFLFVGSRLCSTLPSDPASRRQPLRFTNPSPPSGWIKDFHLQAVGHARHTRGRNAGCPAPPAQIPACAPTHEAPTSGARLDRPVDAVVCWTCDGAAVTGVTGMGIRIAEAHGIPVLNLGAISPRTACERLAAIRRAAAAS